MKKEPLAASVLLAALSAVHGDAPAARPGLHLIPEANIAGAIAEDDGFGGGLRAEPGMSRDFGVHRSF